MPHHRRRLTRAELLQRMPRCFRPKLQRDQVFDLSMAHHVNLDAIARGEADVEILWQYLGGMLAWSRIAQLLGTGIDEMEAQCLLAHRLVQRWRDTGRIAFEPGEYELARDGVIVMDELAAVVDQPTASAAADWSQAQIDRLTAQEVQHA